MRTPRFSRFVFLAVFTALLLGVGRVLWLELNSSSPHAARPTAASAQASSRTGSASRTGGLPSTSTARAGTDRALDLASLRARFDVLATPGADRGQPPYADFCAGMNADNVDLYLGLLGAITESGLATERSRLQSALLLRWATFDRPAALEMATGLPSRDRNLSLNQLVRAWGRTDRDAAWDYIRTTSAAHADDRNLSLPGPFLAERGLDDPEWALNQLRELPGGRAADLAAQDFFGAQAAVDLDRARSWLDSLPSDSMRDRALYALTLHVAQADPPLALDSLRNLSLPSAERERSASRITRVWAAESPALAVTWLAGQTDNPLFSVVARTVAEQLTTRDRNAARAWLTPHAADPGYLPALLAHVEAAGAADEIAAQQWAEALPPGSNRTALLAFLVDRGP